MVLVPKVILAALLPLLINSQLPEVNMDVPTLISYNGYEGETHQLVTEDGYILQVHRIPRGKNMDPLFKNGTLVKRPVFFLQHGLLASSSNWVTNPPNESFAFVLADAGFDVWMGNFRGNKYSMNHKTLDPNGEKFWEFSWDEMGDYDLPSMLSYALEHSGADELFYVGHSEGTMTAFAQFSGNTSGIAKKVKHFYALAPVAKVAHIQGLLRFLGDHSWFLDYVLNMVGVKDFLPQNWLMTEFSKLICGAWVTNPLCSNVLFLIAGPNSDQLNATRLPVYMAHTPAGTSMQNIVHFGQAVLANTFSKYDYGSDTLNMQHYSQKTPPAYHPETMKVPVSMIWGDKDWLGDPEDVKYLLATLTSMTQNIEMKDFNHLDFIWGERAAKEIYHPIIEHAKNLTKF